MMRASRIAADKDGHGRGDVGGEASHRAQGIAFALIHFQRSEPVGLFSYQAIAARLAVFLLLPRLSYVALYQVGRSDCI